MRCLWRSDAGTEPRSVHRGLLLLGLVGSMGLGVVVGGLVYRREVGVAEKLRKITRGRGSR